MKLSYNPLRQLEKVEDWLGTTRTENDPMGRALKVQYPDGKEVSYTYGKSGERTGITYPDGKKAGYEYDSLLRLTGLDDGNGTINYAYDEMGRPVRKTFPGGMETAYEYNDRGYLSALTHTDSEGILDRYTYAYDLMGNKTTIEKERRGLPEESGVYAYGYDALGRLGSVMKNGVPLKKYGYDAFGNRTVKEDYSGHTPVHTAYAYNAMNQLISRADGVNEETYSYDKRGNLSLVMENGAVKNRYTYGSINRLEKAVNAGGVLAMYEYNGLGHRTGKTEGETRVHYTIDLTRAYHNLLQKEEEGNSQTFYWDGNVTAMTQSSERGIKELETSVPYRITKESIRAEEYNITPIFHYYLQDELGSPVKVSGYDTGKTGMMGVNGMTDGTTNATPHPYLTYGYDEFGNDLYDDLLEEGIPNPYSRHGEGQPFGYTGYQPDRIAGTCYAQAREYMPENGRFGAVDVIKGNIMVPETLNEYGYCLGNPMVLVDRDGKTAVVPSASSKAAKIKTQEIFERAFNIGKSIFDSIEERYIKVDDYNVTERKELIEFMKYAESGGVFNGELHDPLGGANKRTIGYGHDTDENNDYDLYIGVILSEEEGEEILLKDLEDRVPTEWLKYMEDQGHNFTPNEIDALVSLTFPLGKSVMSLKGSPNLTAMIIDGEWSNQEMYDEFLTYDKTKENLDGLHKRHAAEARIFIFGTYDIGFYDRELDTCVE